MKRFLRRLYVPFARDDLFLRVVFLLAGILFGGLGITISVLATRGLENVPGARLLAASRVRG